MLISGGASSSWGAEGLKIKWRRKLGSPSAVQRCEGQSRVAAFGTSPQQPFVYVTTSPCRTKDALSVKHILQYTTPEAFLFIRGPRVPESQLTNTCLLTACWFSEP